MARPKIFNDRVAIVSNVSLEFKLHLDRLAKQISEDSGKVITVGELIRVACDRMEILTKPVYTKKIDNLIPIISNVSKEYKESLEQLAIESSKATGKRITLSKLIRIYLEKTFPLINYDYLYNNKPKEEKNE